MQWKDNFTAFSSQFCKKDANSSTKMETCFIIWWDKNLKILKLKKNSSKNLQTNITYLLSLTKMAKSLLTMNKTNKSKLTIMKTLKSKRFLNLYKNLSPTIQASLSIPKSAKETQNSMPVTKRKISQIALLSLTNQAAKNLAKIWKYPSKTTKIKRYRFKNKLMINLKAKLTNRKNFHKKSLNPQIRL